jgi:hypothetical protein
MRRKNIEIGSVINEAEISHPLSDSERQAIIARADLRRLSQEFKINALNLAAPEKKPQSTDDYGKRFEQSLDQVKREAGGEARLDKATAEKILMQKEDVAFKAELIIDSAPGFAQLSYATLAEAAQLAGEDYSDYLRLAKEVNETREAELIIKPSDLLPDAIVMGISQREVAGKELPSIQVLAENALADKDLLASIALILSESDRAEFLSYFPEELRERAGKFMDIEVSKLLHQSLVEEKTGEYNQRLEVRKRLFRELQSALAQEKENTALEVALIGETLGKMGDDARPLLLDLMRDELQDRQAGKAVERKKDYLSRVMKVILDNFDDFRANDLIMKFAGEPAVPTKMSEYLLKKLVERGYVPKDSEEWYLKNKKETKGNTEAITSMDVVKGVINDLGVMPTAEVLQFVADDKNWKVGRKILDLFQRVEKIKASQIEFEALIENSDLVDALHEDDNKAMTYFLLNGGKDRFNLINNYDFGKFKEMLGLIADLRVHEKPMKKFKEALVNSGMSSQEADVAISRLRGGHYPLAKESQARQRVSFEVSENAAIKNANAELGRIMGKEQLGTMLMFPVYRELALASGVDESIFANTQTFSDRLELIKKLDHDYPELRRQAQEELAPAWQKFGEKMVMELTLDSVFNEATVPVHGEDILPKLDSKRIDLKRIKKDLLVLLKSENKQLRDASNEIRAKKKARQGLVLGMEKQTDEGKKAELQKKIDEIDADLQGLEQRKLALAEVKVDERFNHLSEAEKKQEIENLSQEIAALTEKSPSAIFTYLVMQTVGEERLRESDVNLLREMESHLQGPFQMIADSKLYDRGKREKSRRSNISLNWLDKSKRLMNMVRFADSKICCFSSCNYEMKVQHDTPNKYWVASINKDPLSFVLSMEEDQGEPTEGEEQVSENLGFIFGSFGVDDEGKLAVMFNGFYYAPGGENKEQVEAIMAGAEKVLKGLPVNTVAIASQYGGGAVGSNLPAEYSNSQVEMIRLRALDDGGGDPETKIYDDLGTGSDLNGRHYYSDNVWHKKMK